MENLMIQISERLNKTLKELEERKLKHEYEYTQTMNVFENYKKDLKLLKEASDGLSRDAKYDMKRFLIHLMDLDKEIAELIKAFNIN